MQKRTEALGKELFYELVDADNGRQVEDALAIDNEGFSTIIDPPATYDEIEYMAREGWLWLQYAKENGHIIPTGVMELISLTKALDFRLVKANGDSPLAKIAENHERVFSDARRFAGDEDIIYGHGISMARRRRGYGTLLLQHALDNTPNARVRPIAGYIDLATKTDGSMKLAPNEMSYALNIREGRFVVIGVVDPPVYDSTTTHFAVMRPPDSMPFRVDYDMQRRLGVYGDASKVVADAKELLSSGFIGVSYDMQRHEMAFAKLK